MYKADRVLKLVYSFFISATSIRLAPVAVNPPKRKDGVDGRLGDSLFGSMRSGDNVYIFLRKGFYEFLSIYIPSLKLAFFGILSWIDLRCFAIPPSSFRCFSGEGTGVFTRKTRSVTLTICEDRIPEDSCPLVVFVNSKSGGRQGGVLINRFRSLLNPLQVHFLGGGFSYSSHTKPFVYLINPTLNPRYNMFLYWILYIYFCTHSVFCNTARIIF